MAVGLPSLAEKWKGVSCRGEPVDGTQLRSIFSSNCKNRDADHVNLSSTNWCSICKNSANVMLRKMKQFSVIFTSEISSFFRDIVQFSLFVEDLATPN